MKRIIQSALIVLIIINILSGLWLYMQYTYNKPDYQVIDEAAQRYIKIHGSPSTLYDQYRMDYIFYPEQ